ncbi:hypothetical protein [Alteraurantiacibacter aquimixticola]|uniref:DUF2306 domain-containing protein n=1 Tax=Alteraurantiacibacter aquimixticola TaxID=2489173 RepID=A0A4T3F112_9SPHN|nr:hypothetical protein [Alteraurantiacibacter aquimixticola]TIX50644.1 hypothetical protein E5222_10325 [Alteraurantiacibacter aquimixticola]
MATASTAGAAQDKSVRRGFRRSFHFWMVLLMCAFVFAGFGMSYLYPTAVGTRSGDPPVVHLHGLVFFAWMVLLLVQSALVNAKNLKLHRSLGTFGISIATLVVVMGAMITIVGASGAMVTRSLDDPTTAKVFFLSVVAPPSFAAIFVMAIRAVKRNIAEHRNLVLIATIAVLMPGINRTYMHGLGAEGVPVFATYMTMNAMLAAVLFREWRASGKVGIASWIAAAIVVIPQPVNWLVSSTPQFHEFVYWLGSLVYYR